MTLAFVGVGLWSACGDDSRPAPGERESSTSTTDSVDQLATAPDYRPSLGGGNLATGAAELGQWDPEPGQTQSSNLPRTSGPNTTSTPPGGTSSGASSRTGFETSSATPFQTTSETSSATPSSQTTSEASSATPSQTTSETSSNPSSSSSTSDNGTASDSSGETPEPVTSDPFAPQDGFALELTLEGPITTTAPYRALLFEFRAQDPALHSPQPPPADQPARPLAWPLLKEINPFLYQPKLPFNAQGRAALILQTPPKHNLDPNTHTSRPMAITVYQDLNRDGIWNPNEPFVAALSKVLTYIDSGPSGPARWTMNSDRLSLIDPMAPLTDTPKALTLTRIDRFRRKAAPRISPKALSDGASFVSLVSTAEARDLASNFSPTQRALDVHLRALPSDQDVELTPRSTPPAPRNQPVDLHIPGIRPSYTATRWPVSYARPLGLPVTAPGEYLTRDSTLIGTLVVQGPERRGKSRRLIALWIDDGTWVSAPEGALYAAWLRLGVGWSFIPIKFRPRGLQWADVSTDPNQLAQARFVRRLKLPQPR